MLAHSAVHTVQCTSSHAYTVHRCQKKGIADARTT